ncbi:MAG: hypothetical protein R3F48_01740 [Candidatus Zixiibacteriota bacterium]
MFESELYIIAIKIFLSLIALLALFILTVYILKKLYLMQKFTEYGAGLHHLGFKGKNPFRKTAKMLRKYSPDNIIHLKEWNYLLYSKSERLHVALGFDAFEIGNYVSVTFKSKYTTMADVVGRIPNESIETAGYLSIVPINHFDQILNVHCPFYRLYHALKLPRRARLRLSIMPVLLHVFSDENKIRQFKFMRTISSDESITGHSKILLNVTDWLNKVPDYSKANTYACGEVVEHQKLTNQFTGRSFHVTTIDTGIALIDVFARRRAFWQLPKKGEFIATQGILSGYIENVLDPLVRVLD